MHSSKHADAPAQGSHYKTDPGEQHHQRVHRLGLNWYQGNITKYAERAYLKGQLVDDLIKVIDYAIMWLLTSCAGSMSKDQVHRLTQVLDKVAFAHDKLVDPADGSGATSGYTGQK